MKRGASLAVLAVVLVAVFVTVQGLHFGFGWLNPFGETTKDRSGPAVLKSIQNLSRYEASQGTFQVVVDIDKEAKFLPSSIQGHRTLFIGWGTVDSYVDFGRLGSSDLTVGADHKSATIRLPHAQLEPTTIDTSKSYVYATQTGLLDRIGGFFGGDSGDERQLYTLAAQKIQTAAQQSGLQTRADQNTRLMLENFLKALGYTSTTITAS